MDESSRKAEKLRAEMLERLHRIRGGLPDTVADAMSVVPRHVFVPGVPLEQAYGPGPVVTHRDAEGVPLSSASAAGTVAGMLAQAQIQPGLRVLEVGSGTGYNAALLAYLVGSSGTVTTIEYDPQVADSAREALAAHGDNRVRVVTGDGTLGFEQGAPFDRILVTAGAWDVAPAWWGQLALGGRLVLPLRLRGLTRVVAFERVGDVLRSVSVAEDGFIPMRGIGAVAELNVPIGPAQELTARIDDGQGVDTAALTGALDSARETAWTEVHAPWAWTENLDFWLSVLPGFCRIMVNAEAVTAGRVPRPKEPWGGSWGVVSNGSVAYLIARRIGRTDEMPMLQIGSFGFGPNGADLAARLAERVTTWQQEAGNGIDITIEARRKDHAALPSEAGALVVVDKVDHTFVVGAAQRTVAAMGSGTSD